MNERIEKLAEQAFNEANNGSISGIKIPKEFIEKFAELIIQECVSICKDREVEVAIKEHFGVNNDDKG